MEETVLYLETGSFDPAYNLAFEEYILNCRCSGTYLLLWQNDRTIVIGQNQNAEEEINRSFVDTHQIHVVRRNTGGGAVYHDLGNLNYSFITDAGDAEKLTMSRFTQPIVNSLRGLGLDVAASGRNDILVEGRKVSGTAQRLAYGRILHHGTLLFSSDLSMVSKALYARPEKFLSKSMQSVRSRVGNIRDFLPPDSRMSLPEFWNYIKGSLSGGGLKDMLLAQEELAAIQCLKESKYDTWDWNYGRSPQYNFTNLRKWDGGILEPRILVKDGYISSINFYGDFLSMEGLEPVEQALQGCPFRYDDVSLALARFPLNHYFGSIALEEILATMFYPTDSD